MKFIFLFFVAVLLLDSCKEKSKHVSAISLKDSALKGYLTYSSSLLFHDTTNYDYKFLKAYYLNDKSFFNESEKMIKSSKLNYQKKLSDTTTHHPQIDTMKVDEAYQYYYSAPFCPFGINITISKLGEKINLLTVIYKVKRNSEVKTVDKMYNKKLSSANWYNFEKSIEFADFWGLEKNEIKIGFDADGLTVKGIVRFSQQISKLHFVNRSFVLNTAFYNSFELLLKFSGYKNVCLN